MRRKLMRLDGDPYWRHDDECSDDHLCARCQKEYEQEYGEWLGEIARELERREEQA